MAAELEVKRAHTDSRATALAFHQWKPHVRPHNHITLPVGMVITDLPCVLIDSPCQREH
jgi:hypothetical protein